MGIGKDGRKDRFEIRANTLLVKSEAVMKVYFDYVPVYKKGNRKWEMQVFDDTDTDFEEGQRYRLYLKTSNWILEHSDRKKGVSFYIKRVE